MLKHFLCTAPQLLAVAVALAVPMAPSGCPVADVTSPGFNIRFFDYTAYGDSGYKDYYFSSGYDTGAISTDSGLSGFFVAPEYGDYTFQLKTKTAASLQLGAKECFSGPLESITDDFSINSIGSVNGGSMIPQKETAVFTLKKNIAYPLKIVHFNNQGAAIFSLTVIDPSGNLHQDYRSLVQQFESDEKPQSYTQSVPSTTARVSQSTKADDFILTKRDGLECSNTCDGDMNCLVAMACTCTPSKTTATTDYPYTTTTDDYPYTTTTDDYPYTTTTNDYPYTTTTNDYPYTTTTTDDYPYTTTTDDYPYTTTTTD
ncbi:hypothetical protein JCM33374_g3594 [Metschnikowia sp. JCM 33374]|nr:hypothetical protein JCM33374_g3594 [Metschnikowia sp. JCM 33374]